MTLQIESLKIKDLGNVITGGTPPTKQRHYYGDKIPLIKPTDMVLGQRYIGNTEESLSDAGIAKFKNKLVPAFTPCVVTIGTIGKSCLTKEKSLVNQAVNCVVVNTKKFDIMYIYYLLQLTIPTVKSLNSGTASGRENVSKSVFENIDIKVVSDIQAQVLIGKYLSNYDSLIENNNRRIAILEDMAQSLYREWFVNFRYPSYEDNFDADGKPKLIDSPLGQIPEGWEVKEFSESFDFWNGKKCAKSVVGEFDLYGANGIVGKAEGWKYENAVIIGRVGAYCGAVEYCFNRFWGSDNTIIAKCKSENNISYLFLLLEYFNLNKYAGGSAQPLLTQTTLKQLKYIAPPEGLVEQFELIVHKLFENVVNLKKRNQNLKQQRDMLLPKLISGKIKL
ncbi:type I restriction enzyme, S subunit [Pseudoalteromonas sp. DSM 26666]|uniref:restriction endonuclease subunit S n=1 Tax=Pseudoalteromonas sp. DSM 26666 TaxID=1761892 RepID=UPI0008F30804|nr:restriction endonuclease subunit S [Pseudoalteromonas sp. DSM 26666]SFT63013.1 type I restriction enzyme, S subunit [Pseudoalteromonas sp. DSM 26666]